MVIEKIYYLLNEENNKVDKKKLVKNKKKRKVQYKVPQYLRSIILSIFGSKCLSCGSSGKAIQIDHIIPR